MGSLDPQPKIRIAIAGGGIAGLCLARGLLQYEHLDVQVYEATAAYRDIGAGLTLHHNAIQAMDLIDPAIKQAYYRKANSMAADDEKEMSTQVIMVEGKHKGEVIAHLGRAKGRKTVARKDLLQGYCALVPSDRLHMNKRLVKIEGDGPVTLTFKDGSLVTADCLIGSDGIHSCTRKHLLGDHPAVNPVNRERWYRISREVPIEEATQVLSDKFLG
jgi:salicylate hydroxylase